ncbi:pentapeptide repeat-containing protein [Actinosynnema sp. NPDC023794]
MPSSLTPYLPAGLAFLVLLGLWSAVRLAGRAVRAGKPPAAEAVLPGRRLPVGAKGSMAWALVKWVLLAVLLAAATGYGLYRLLGRPALPSSTSFTTTELLDLLKIGLAVVGGLGAVVALAVGYRKQQVSEAAHVVALGQEERERTKLFNERFGVATAQLGHEQPAVRIAGVYALAGLADDWSDQRQTCVDVLCAYLRLPRADEAALSAEREVVTTVFRVLRNHLGSRFLAGGWSDLDLDFTGVRFDDVDFSDVTFGGRVVFDGAVFSGPHTSFENAVFRGAVLSCHGTGFEDGVVSFRNARFDRTAVEFVGARFTGTTVDFTGSEIVKHPVDFYRCDIKGTRLVFRAADLLGASIRFDGGELVESEVDFRHAYARMSRVLVVERSTVRRSTLDLRAELMANSRVWLSDSEFTQVEIRTVTREEAGEWRVRGLALVDTELPGFAGALTSDGPGEPD